MQDCRRCGSLNCVAPDQTDGLSTRCAICGDRVYESLNAGPRVRRKLPPDLRRCAGVGERSCTTVLTAAQAIRCEPCRAEHKVLYNRTYHRSLRRNDKNPAGEATKVAGPVERPHKSPWGFFFKTPRKA